MNNSSFDLHRQQSNASSASFVKKPSNFRCLQPKIDQKYNITPNVKSVPKVEPEGKESLSSKKQVDKQKQEQMMKTASFAIECMDEDDFFCKNDV